MALNNRLVGQRVVIKGQVVAVFLTVLSLLVVTLPAKSLEIDVIGYQLTESKSQGYSISLANNFSRRSPFYWGLGLSRYNDLSIEWNNSELEFPLDSVEASLSYRHKFASRSPSMRNLSMEFKVGAAASLTDNKFTWEELDEEKYFSETGDINGFLAISAQYKMSSNASAVIGVKHFPEMSEFGGISSVFLGVKFNFSSTQKYYGN